MKKINKFIRRHVAVAKQLRKCPVDRKKAGFACFGSGSAVVQPDPIF